MRGGARRCHGGSLTDDGTWVDNMIHEGALGDNVNTSNGEARACGAHGGTELW